MPLRVVASSTSRCPPSPPQSFLASVVSELVPVQMWASPRADVGKSRCRRGRLPVRMRGYNRDAAAVGGLVADEARPVNVERASGVQDGTADGAITRKCSAAHASLQTLNPQHKDGHSQTPCTHMCELCSKPRALKELRGAIKVLV